MPAIGSTDDTGILTTIKPLEYPNQYDLIHDAYGPGVIIAWILACHNVYAIWLLPSRSVLSGSHQSRSQPEDYDSLTYDVITILLYPFAVSIHLLIQIRQYPGPMSEIWIIQGHGGRSHHPLHQAEKYIPYAKAISSAIWVCTMSCAVNLWLMLISFISAPPHLPSAVMPIKRLCLLGLSTAWTMVVLDIAILRGEQKGTMLLINMSHFWMDIMAFGLLPIFAAMALIFQVSNPVGFCLTLKRSNWGTKLADPETFCVMTLMTSCLLGVCYVATFIFGYMAYWEGLPKSNHSITDFGQLFALAAGVIQLMHTLYGFRLFLLAITFHLGRSIVAEWYMQYQGLQLEWPSMANLDL